ncbi:Crp/Fnr family transcriptional regulator [Haloferula sp.]|uniref:Crp/Fnr family transcriptional regulator n=1 Tax=Haloferula sp. TaxID=2497595 RepID=UPI003C719F81
MIDINCECCDLPTRKFSEGEVIIREGGRSGCLFFLVSGVLEVRRGEVLIGEISDSGSVIGEISVLLDRPHTAGVTAKTDATFHVAEDAVSFLREHPEVNLHIALDLAKKVDALTCYITDLKQQYEGDEGHLGMVHEVLDSLVHLKH